ncbi:flippase [Geomesophilobacter sediminis]|uniref:Flippase n=1 Tax=Geomesophilobacter sediminis TaxID=2798584 RepID=A0A8J7J0T7_9BACT|nr:flippase [Geomesophilobacter sediminis]MBJ6724078.1 flippase [Geomesophilobacter sediminis]
MNGDLGISRFLPGNVRTRWSESPSFRAVFGNIAWLFFDKVVRMGGGLALGMLLARFLGPTDFGLLAYTGAFVSLFAALAAMGLDSIVVREIVRRPDETDEILGTAFALKLCGAVAAFLLSVATAQLMHPGEGVTRALIAIGALSLTFVSFDVIDFRFQAEVSSRYTVWARCLAFCVAFCVKLYLILVGAPLLAFGWATAGEALCAALAMAGFYRWRNGALRRWRPSRTCARRLLNDSWPLVISGVVIMVYMRIDQVMLGHLSGAREVGIYAVSVAVAEAAYFVPIVMVNTLFPGIVEAHGTSDDLFHRELQRLYNLMALAGYAVAVPVTLLGGWAIRIFYGPAYAAAGPMLTVLVWAGLFVNLGVARSAFLTARNWTRLHLVTVFLGAVINVVLNLLLIPALGGMGAVIASCVAYWFAAHGACFLFAPLRETGWMMTRALLFPRPW